MSEVYKKVTGGIKTTSTYVRIETIKKIEELKNSYLYDISLIQEKIDKVDIKLNTK